MTETARILVLDDARSVRESFGPLLLGLLPEDAEVRSVGNVDHALTVLRSFRPNLMFLDLDLHTRLTPELESEFPSLVNRFTRLYGVNGDDFLGVLHEREPYLRVVVCTAWDPDEARVRAVARHPGVFAVLTKPVREPELVELLARAGLRAPLPV